MLISITLQYAPQLVSLNYFVKHIHNNSSQSNSFFYFIRISGKLDTDACLSIRHISQPDRTTRYVGYLYHPKGEPLRTVENFFSKPNNWIKLRYMPLNYDGDSSAYTWCELFRIMRSANEKIDLYDPSLRSDLFPYCRGNNNAELRAAREGVIARNPGVEQYLKEWGSFPPENE